MPVVARPVETSVTEGPGVDEVRVGVKDTDITSTVGRLRQSSTRGVTEEVNTTGGVTTVTNDTRDVEVNGRRNKCPRGPTPPSTENVTVVRERIEVVDV